MSLIYMPKALFIWCKKWLVHDCNMQQIVVKHLWIFWQLENAFSYERIRKKIAEKETACHLKTTHAISTKILYVFVDI